MPEFPRRETPEGHGPQRQSGGIPPRSIRSPKLAEESPGEETQHGEELHSVVYQPKSEKGSAFGYSSLDSGRYVAQKIKRVFEGAIGDRPASPELGDLFSANDPTNEVYVCFVTGSWSKIGDGTGSMTWLGLNDTPGSFAGQALKVVRVNSGETALELAEDMKVRNLEFTGLIKGADVGQAIETQDNVSAVIVIKAWDGSAQVTVAVVNADASSPTMDIERGKLTGALNAGSQKINTLGAPAADADAARFDSIEHGITVGMAGVVAAAADTAAFTVAVPFKMSIKRVKITFVTAPTSAVTVQPRRATNALTAAPTWVNTMETAVVGANNYGVEKTFASAVTVNEGDRLGFSTTGGADGEDILVEFIGTQKK